MRNVRVAVLGGGSWGTTVASLAANNAQTTVWARSAETVQAINEEHENPAYLKGLPLHADLRSTTSLEEAVWDADVLVTGVPSQALRSTLKAVAPLLRPWVPVVNLAKGLEQGTGKRMTQVINETLPGQGDPEERRRYRRRVGRGARCRRQHAVLGNHPRSGRDDAARVGAGW